MSGILLPPYAVEENKAAVTRWRGKLARYCGGEETEQFAYCWNLCLYNSRPDKANPQSEPSPFELARQLQRLCEAMDRGEFVIDERAEEAGTVDAHIQRAPKGPNRRERREWKRKMKKRDKETGRG